ncbi:MAG: carbon-nitrogen hydrolase family protein [Proteobacteria bacterium]|nr:carbon-nitrogen hydrolase family protein [Pseudomonadota bacterium]
MITLCASQYPIENLENFAAFAQKMEKWVSKAKENGAQLLLLPEYACVEMVTKHVKDDLALFEALQKHLDDYLQLFTHLAQKYQIYIQPGTMIVKSVTGRFVNRAYFFSPTGFGYQDKLQLVSQEQGDGLLEAGSTQTLFDTALGLIGIAVCYDSEFPELVRNLCAKGAKLILVPSYTISLHSFHRVFYSCRARAIENQCYVAMSCAVGRIQYGTTDESITGQANIFTPIDVGFSEDGVLAQGTLNQEQMITSTLSFRKIDQVRSKGQVRNFNDFMNTKTFETKQQKL